MTNKKPPKPFTKTKSYRKMRKWYQKYLAPIFNRKKPVTKTKTYKWFRKTGLPCIGFLTRLFLFLLIIIPFIFTPHNSSASDNTPNSLSSKIQMETNGVKIATEQISRRPEFKKLVHENVHILNINDIPGTMLTVDATFYCICKECLGEHYDPNALTKTETKPVEGRTLAVDPYVIPLNSKIVFVDVPPGMDYLKEYHGKTKIFIAEDIGGAIVGNKIDIFMKDHQKAKNLGHKTFTIKIIK